MNLISRAEGRFAGSLTYFTGKPCPRGHIAPRYVSCGKCLECLPLENSRDAAKHAKRRRAHPRSRMLRANVQNRRRAAKIKRTPAWADETKILEAYELANLLTADTGYEWHVDHVIPLQGKRVSGLHTPENLQVVPATVNLRKYNSYEI